MQKKENAEFAKELFETYSQMMYKIAFNILQNKFSAEDAVQNAFLWIMGNLDKIYEIPDFERAFYFSTIIEHISIDLLNEQKKQLSKAVDDYQEFAVLTSAEEEALDNITIQEIEEALKKLSDTDYSLMYLYLFKQMKPKEIAKELNIPEKNIRTYIMRARKRLIKILKREGF